MAYSDSIGFAEPYVIHSCTDSDRNITIKEFVDRCLAFNNFIVNFKLKLLPTMPNFWMPEGQNQWWYEGTVYFENNHYKYAGIGKIVFYGEGCMYLGNIWNNLDTGVLTVDWYKQLFQKV
nr:MAG TPA: hypothetical protein [Caudoviricetes sp.]